MKILCITVNYRTPDRTLQLLRSLRTALEGLDAAIAVVENGSGDDSVERLEAGWAEALQDRPAVLHKVATNRGFGAGNNVAIRAALSSPAPPDVFYLINPDAVPDPDALRVMADFLERHPSVGIAGSGIRDGTGGPHSSAFRFPSPAGELEGELRLGPVSRLLARWRIPIEPGGPARPVDWVSGASCALRRQMLEEVGLFDEEFFLYFEETDLCRRARDGGWQVWTVPECQVRHEGAVVTGLDDHSKPREPYWFHSRSRYLRKHDGLAGLLLANFAWLVGGLGFRVRRLLTRRTAPIPPRLLRDFLRHSWG